MSYSVNLTDPVIRKFNGWRLSSHEFREILKGLDVLSSEPRRRLIRVGPPYDELQYDVIVAGVGSPPRDILYSFTVRYGADEETLFVVDCDRLDEDDS
jgi:hypothetical protein